MEGFEKHPNGTITSVRTKLGRIEGAQFIVATGAWTASLIPAWNSMLAAGQAVGYLRLTPKEIAELGIFPFTSTSPLGFTLLLHTDLAVILRPLVMVSVKLVLNLQSRPHRPALQLARELIKLSRMDSSALRLGW